MRQASEGMDETPEEMAAGMVVEATASEDIVSSGYGSEAGILFVHDQPAAAGAFGVEPAVLLEHPLSFVDDDGTLVVPWPVTRRISREAAPRLAEKILPGVADAEARAERRSVYGEYYGGRRGNDSSYITPEICAEVDQRWAPGYELVRQWCGAEAVARHDELVALRAEVLRVGQVAERAIRALKENGHGRAAAELERELGVPVALLRASGKRRAH